VKTGFAVVTALVALIPVTGAAQPPTGQVILDNPSIRATVQSFATGRHQGIEAEIGIVIEGELTLESPEGRQELRPGSVYWMPGLTPHDVRNTGAGPARMWDIFLKRCE
jgi:mannose-6-phosphate isomerase-like protein (cupin superfamily)